MLRPASREDETMITDHFINLRYAGAESPHHLALQCGELTQIAPWVAVPTATWRQWVRHKQQFAKVVAAGWSTHRAVLISKSAARLWGMWVISREGEEVECVSKWRGWLKDVAPKNIEPISVTLLVSNASGWLKTGAWWNM